MVSWRIFQLIARTRSPCGDQAICRLQESKLNTGACRSHRQKPAFNASGSRAWLKAQCLVRDAVSSRHSAGILIFAGERMENWRAE
jgi:hypothetical protein